MIRRALLALLLVSAGACATAPAPAPVGADCGPGGWEAPPPETQPLTPEELDQPQLPEEPS